MATMMIASGICRLQMVFGMYADVELPSSTEWRNWKLMEWVSVFIWTNLWPLELFTSIDMKDFATDWQMIQLAKKIREDCFYSQTVTPSEKGGGIGGGSEDRLAELVERASEGGRGRWKCN